MGKEKYITEDLIALGLQVINFCKFPSFPFGFHWDFTLKFGLLPDLIKVTQNFFNVFEFQTL